MGTSDTRRVVEQRSVARAIDLASLSTPRPTSRENIRHHSPSKSPPLHPTSITERPSRTEVKSASRWSRGGVSSKSESRLRSSAVLKDDQASTSGLSSVMAATTVGSLEKNRNRARWAADYRSRTPP
jgi:hypothetical protein